MDTKKKYRAKPNTWYDEGTIVELLVDIPEIEGGLYRGIRHGDYDEEMCSYHEFEVIDESD